ncbi:MAG: hypothetical protein EHM64_10120 [Ignavibacteriae bacterium]|nr:MAG: hypothetical protein EHM64_10120 [Ignavibacteriota bacterium]
MRLYFYSRELQAFVEAKWLKAKYVLGGILLVTIVFGGVMRLNQSAGNPLSARSVNILDADNNFMQQQVNQMSPRVGSLETQTMKLNEQAKYLHLLFLGSKMIGDTASRIMRATQEIKIRSLEFAAKSNRR